MSIRYLKLKYAVSPSAIMGEAKTALVRDHAEEIAKHVTAGITEDGGTSYLHMIFPTVPRRMGIRELISFNASLAADQADFPEIDGPQGNSRRFFIAGYIQNAAGLKMDCNLEGVPAEEYKQGWLAYDMDAAK